VVDGGCARGRTNAKEGTIRGVAGGGSPYGGVREPGGGGGEGGEWVGRGGSQIDSVMREEKKVKNDEDHIREFGRGV